MGGRGVLQAKKLNMFKLLNPHTCFRSKKEEITRGAIQGSTLLTFFPLPPLFIYLLNLQIVRTSGSIYSNSQISPGLWSCSGEYLGTSI